MKCYRTAILRQTATGLVLVALLGGCSQSPAVTETNKDVDVELQSLDTQMQEINPEDYNEGQLGDMN